MEAGGGWPSEDGGGGGRGGGLMFLGLIVGGEGEGHLVSGVLIWAGSGAQSRWLCAWGSVCSTWPRSHNSTALPHNKLSPVQG